MSARRRARLRRTGLLAATAAALILFAVAVTGGGDEPGTSAAPPVPSSSPSVSASPAAVDPPEPSPTPTPSVVERGEGTWLYARATGKKIGDEGRLMRYRVATEKGTGQDPELFAARVDATYADERGWTAAGHWRFERVGKSDDADFTVYLASPKTRAVLCRALDDEYTSCRIGDRVVINLARWLLAVEDYGAPVELYQQYVVNHETGHALGHGHELCPGEGEPAPVMEQQTLGLHGCTPNAWPYPFGGPDRYTGPPGAY